MARYAVLNNDNIVDALIAADGLDEIAVMFSSFKLIELADDVMCNQGYLYNSVDGTFSKVESTEQAIIEPIASQHQPLVEG